MQQTEVTALLTLAGINHQRLVRIENQYWPLHVNYDEMRRQYPWWAVHTEDGIITIGWRKRVIHIDWCLTSRRGLVTEDDVTKDQRSVHAWSMAKALEYLIKYKSLPVVDSPTKAITECIVQGKVKILETLDMFGRISAEDEVIEPVKEMIGLVNALPDNAELTLLLIKPNGTTGPFSAHLKSKYVNVHMNGTI